MKKLIYKIPAQATVHQINHTVNMMNNSNHRASVNYKNNEGILELHVPDNISNQELIDLGGRIGTLLNPFKHIVV